MTHPTDTSEANAPRMEQIDPTTLLIDLNVRADATPDRALIDSVRDVGVLVPLVAVRGADGVRVRYGHRRTLAAVEAHAPTVPVWVFDADPAGTDVDRIVRQWAENEHRAALTDADRLAAVEQLSAFGVSAAQITKRLRAPRKQVDAALTAAGSTLAKAAVSRCDFLDLLQAATLAEFDATDDSDTVKALVAAAKSEPGQFEHIAQRARDARDTKAREQAARDVIVATGVTVLDGRAPSQWADTAERLVRELTDADGQRLTPVGHATCPGHAAYLVIERGYWTEEQAATVRLADEAPSSATAYTEDPADYDDDDADEFEDDDAGEDLDPAAGGDADDAGQDGAEAPVWRARYAAAYVCTDHTTYGHQGVYTGLGYGRSSKPAPANEAEAEQQKAAASAERKRVIENNRSWASNEKVRRTFVATLLRRKTAPKGTAQFVARALIEGNHAVRRAMEGQHTGLADLLGIPYGSAGATSTTLSQPRPVSLLDEANDARAQVLVLAVVLAAYEAATDKHSWRNVDGGTTRYLRFLTEQGYDLSEVERLACGETSLPCTADSDTTCDEDGEAAA